MDDLLECDPHGDRTSPHYWRGRRDMCRVLAKGMQECPTRIALLGCAEDYEATAKVWEDCETVTIQ